MQSLVEFLRNLIFKNTNQNHRFKIVVNDLKSCLKFYLFFTLILTLKVTASTNGKSEDLPKVMLEEVVPQKDQKRILLPLKVEPKIQSLVTADVEGSVTRILKTLGSFVKSGDIILYLENKDPGFTYAPVPVRAPMGGILSQIWTTQMSKVQRGEKLFTIINPKAIKLTGELPSQELTFVKMGMKAFFTTEIFKERNFSMIVTGVSPLIDPRTGTASIEFEFLKNELSPLPPIGSLGQANIEIDQGEVIIIPESALIFREGKPMVRILQGENKFSKKPIELGEQRDATYVIKSGITKGEKLIVRASRPLKEGETIEVENPTSKSQ